MTLGEKIKAARLEKHMTQKQVVGDRITRNMLSQIENGSAVPSVKTLEYLAEVLGLPAGYFLTASEEASGVPERLIRARGSYRAGDFAACLKALETPEQPEEHVQPENGTAPEADGPADREAAAMPEAERTAQNSGGTAESCGIPDAVQGYEDELFLLRARAELGLAEVRFAEGAYDSAAEFAGAAVRDNARTLYGSDALRIKALLVLIRCSLQQNSDPGSLVEQCREAYHAQGLEEAYHLTMAEYLLSRGEREEARRELDAASCLAADSAQPQYRLLRGRLELEAQDYQAAAAHLEQAEQLAERSGKTELLPGIYAMLETCWRELEDFRKAYQYASLQLKLRKTEK